MIRCDGLDDLLDAAGVLAEQGVPGGSRVGIVANARGPLVVCADACTDAGLEVVRQPRRRPLSPAGACAAVQLVGDSPGRAWRRPPTGVTP